MVAAALNNTEVQCFQPAATSLLLRPRIICSGHVDAINSQIMARQVAFRMANKFDDDDLDEDDLDDEDDDDEDEEIDPYTAVANSEFQDNNNKNRDDDSSSSSGISTLTSAIDWGGELGKLRQRMGDIESGKSQDPSNALFRLMSATTPNQLIGQFVSTANPKVVKACSDAVNSLLGGLSSPAMGIETIVKTNGEKIGSLCFQLQMTGYLFRNVEYIMALKEMMNLKGSATLEDYKDAFDRLDKDNSGFIESAEVRSLLDDIYDGEAPSFEVDAFVQFFDKNKDGKISWDEFEIGLGSAMSQQSQSSKELFNNLLPTSSSSSSSTNTNDDDDDDGDDADDYDDISKIEPEISGEIEIELESGETIKIGAKEYISSLKSEAEALKAALRREKIGSQPAGGGIVGASRQSSGGGDFGGIAQYIATRQGDIKALTEGIQPEIVDTMKQLVDFVMEGGEDGPRKGVPKEQIEMELPGSALQQLALWQLVLGYRLREAEATGEYLKLLE